MTAWLLADISARLADPRFSAERGHLPASNESDAASPLTWRNFGQELLL
jgi:hypothetical protein